MKLQLVHTNIVLQENPFGHFNFNYLIVVDDSEIKIGDIVLEEYVDGTKGLEQIDTLNDINVLLQKRLTHHLSLNGAPVLEGVELLPPLKDDLEKLAWEFYWRRNPKTIIAESSRPDLVIGYVEGYKKTKEKNKFTEEDMKYAIEKAWLMAQEEETIYSAKEKIIQSLSQPKLPTAFDTETKQYIYEN